MSSGAKPAKRAKTIDAFFVPKQQTKTVLGVQVPADKLACAKASSGRDAPMSDPPEANLAAGSAAAAPADENLTPRRSGRKRRSRADSPPPPDSGTAPAVDATTQGDADAPAALTAAVQVTPRRSSRLRRSKGEAEEAAAAATTAEVAAAVAATAAGSSDAAGPGPSSGAVARPLEQEAGQQQQEQLSGQQPGTVQERTPSPPLEGDDLNPTVRAKIAANRNRALARRAVAEASAPGAPPLKLSALLVEESWREALGDQITGPNAPLKKLEAFLHSEWKAGKKEIFPPKDCIFQAFNACPLDQVRVVILGQDPYHGPGQAMGLSFSVPRGVGIPPSLLNMYKEAARDLGWADLPKHGDLTSWTLQGVLLLNTCLTVRQGEANSHSKRGWEAFTDAAIKALSARRSGIVFLLWGNPAQAKANLIDTRKHKILRAAHPSPLSAHRGFMQCGHFSQANQLLQAQGLEPIDWRPAP